MHFEKVPVGSDARQHVVKEVVEVFTEAISDVDNVVSQRNLVLSQIPSYLTLNHALSDADVFQALLDLLLKRGLEVKFVD